MFYIVLGAELIGPFKTQELASKYQKHFTYLERGIILLSVKPCEVE